MSIVRKVRAVENLFKTLEKEIRYLHHQTGIHCSDNCIRCCTTPKIVATQLEFYPLAYHLYKTGQADFILEKIDKINDSTICPVLTSIAIEENRIGCIYYAYRGLICRLFSYNYTVDKYDRRKIAACKTIKLNQPQQVDKANEILLKMPIGPKASDYYSRLRFIDYFEAKELYPIGDAIRLAIESIITDSNYRGKKAV